MHSLSLQINRGNECIPLAVELGIGENLSSESSTVDRRERPEGTSSTLELLSDLLLLIHGLTDLEITREERGHTMEVVPTRSP